MEIHAETRQAILRAVLATKYRNTALDYADDQMTAGALQRVADKYSRGATEALAELVGERRARASQPVTPR